MPYSNNSGGPWGGGGNKGGNKGGGRNPWGSGGGGGGDDGDRGGPPQGGGGQGPDIDRIMRKGQEQLRVLMGGRGGIGGGRGGDGGPSIGKGGAALIGLAAVGAWLFMSFYTVRPEEQSVELFLGEFSAVGNPGLNFAPWPLVTKEIIEVTRERTEELGRGTVTDEGLMLTGDANIVDIDFQVVWTISNPADFLFNIANQQDTIRSVSESAMREVIGRSQLGPVLNRDRGIISEEVRTLIQDTLDSYGAGVNIVRLNFDRADPPREVIDAFRDVQAAEQDRDTFQNRADAYANQRLAGARGEAAEILEQAEGYRAQVVNRARGEASRFVSVYEEYAKAPEVTRQRLYIETMERVFGGVDKVIIDQALAGGAGGQGIVPYLPLNELRRSGGAAAAPAPGGAAGGGGSANNVAGPQLQMQMQTGGN
ncbi:FtsH protease activity modulator HflK [Halovulum dunhuangense]|uniref:Protein HflK n=1 Tax=Halovulum dunhuangense TaxID=1505036 RepID=A0A849L1W5_9RHOB|nr:FtsH protease activity modulator HflK [Halovulum dunhuangense]NNU80255.1 FtsH protease activity modulator HflK [Halovulum dunhuangense]